MTPVGFGWAKYARSFPLYPILWVRAVLVAKRLEYDVSVFHYVRKEGPPSQKEKMGLIELISNNVRSRFVARFVIVQLWLEFQNYLRSMS